MVGPGAAAAPGPTTALGWFKTIRDGYCRLGALAEMRGLDREARSGPGVSVWFVHARDAADDGALQPMLQFRIAQQLVLRLTLQEHLDQEP
ncbi:hypothetical protein [Streptomyces sp. ME19-01-6]|uniref:hypothetical protein n=1 Tax=Streptomyces sp. ME19-01-6 TaxID=3028686 RepID=UPI0029A738EB|nr:hypothetical protein [Streptomyces sp. ME19-01-6]MDX3232493.1 hypothetical protein [Streptomyces sp. ME19-01-6]